ncbi:MAG: exodeoxyribonuclease VII small subunit [Bdellovibrionales bacterium]|nr:exodeoxyribonuclease VII small subunit [Bdellovibrionales bacterium]
MANQAKAASFEENFKKLELLSQELQDNKITIDELVPRIKEAVAAIKICKGVLNDTEAKLIEINKEFEELEVELPSDE